MCLYAIHSTNNTQVMEELVSDCFIKLWENRKQIEIRFSVQHYLFLMMRNAIIDYHRKKKFMTGLVDEIQEPADETVFDEGQSYALLYLALEELPQQRRKILEMAVFDALSYNEIAQKLDISRNTVKTQIARAYRFLKEKLDPKDFYLFCFLKPPKKNNASEQ